MKPESILVIPRSHINCFLKEGFFQSPALQKEVLNARFYIERDFAEINPAFKQPIGYSVIACPIGVLVYERVPKEGEKRLHGKLSIGFGGHVDDPETYAQAHQREIYREEIIWPEGLTAEDNIAGFVNIDDPEIDGGVHAVHLGMVHVIRIPLPYALQCPKEEAGKIRIVGYLDPETLSARVGEFEAWSQTLINSPEFMAELCIEALREGASEREQFICSIAKATGLPVEV
jgi:predicted NUDIX family phosphoesterase